jgi:acetylornithine deacetylase/succinyl-diaminopimelate desuccinylase-like protein
MADVAPNAGGVGAALAFARGRHGRQVAELLELVRRPTVSAQPQHAAAIVKCGQALARRLRGMGFEHVELVPTARHPFVYADWLHAPGAPTVLVYGHYDVQPADPESAWRAPPFQPVVRNGNVLGRGACDDKGQLLAHLTALEARLRVSRRLPVNVRCVLDGEEEIGSPGLRRSLARDPRPFTADLAVMSDTRMLGPGRPALTYALRGSLSLELDLRGPQRDLHSGNFGGAIANPLEALAQVVGGLHDSAGRVSVPGFYDRVRSVSRPERVEMARTGPTDAEILRAAGVERAGRGEPGYTLYERTTIRPALTVNGVDGGYRGPGGKAIIPSRATAKINLRLVPDQDPDDVEQLLRSRISLLVPPGIAWSLRRGASARPAVLDPRHPGFRAAEAAYERAFGARATLVRSGGTIPLVAELQERLGIPTVLMGFALPDDGIHGPNEKFGVDRLFRGTEACIWFLEELGRLAGRSVSRTTRRLPAVATRRPASPIVGACRSQSHTH